MKVQQSVRGIQKFGFLALILILLISTGGQSQSYAAPTSQEEQPYQAIPFDGDAYFVNDLSFGETLGRKAQNPKLDTSLAELASISTRSIEEVVTFAASQSFRLSGDRVQVHITTSIEHLDAAINVVIQAGGEVTVIGRNTAVLQAWLPVRMLDTLTEHESVFFIRRPMEAVLMGEMRAGTSNTEAITAMNADAWHDAGHTGAGVKVAIIDGGFLGYKDLLGSDLPGSVIVKNFVDGETNAQVDGTTEHGTACAEIVHDIAPDADLYLVKIDTNLDLQEAVDYAIAQEVDIISTSLGWYNLTPGDGTGEFEELVQDARDAGILWLTAASNDREAHWGGLFYRPDGDYDNQKVFHFFSGDANLNVFVDDDGEPLFIPSGVRISVFLRWDDWGNVNQDYDLRLYRWSGTEWIVFAFSENIQDGGAGQEPTEFISTITSGSPTVYAIAIGRYESDRRVNLELFAPKISPLNFPIYPRSLSNLADAPTAMTIAALDTSNPYPQESYSSEGPTNGPGGTLEGGFIKPDLSGFANVSTESYGVGKFNGTSSATPHVTGAAALVVGANSDFKHDDVQAFLEENAVDMGSPEMDTIYGHGRLYLGEPHHDTPINHMIFLPLVINQFSPPPPDVPVLNKIDNPDGGNDYTVSWKSATNATGYILQEADNINFSSPITAYDGPDTSIAITGKDVGTYFYRVKSKNAAHESEWSNTESVEVTVELPDLPEAPILHEINNDDGDGDYSVNWSASAGAETYSLQEATDLNFTDASTVYSGPNTSVDISGRDVGTYYYRVRAVNPNGQSDWSNTETVVVTVPELPDPPEPGNWSGTTNQGRSISWIVSSDGTAISNLELAVGWGGACGASWTQYYLQGTTISDNKFSKSSGGATVTGTFTSTTTAEGTYSATLVIYYPSYCTATRSGTWTASPSE